MSKKSVKYITTRLVRSKSSQAFKEGADLAMDTVGYLVVIEEGWVVRKNKDGSTERIKPINSADGDLILELD